MSSTTTHTDMVLFHRFEGKLFYFKLLIILSIIKLNRQATFLKGQEIIRRPWSATAREMLLRKVSLAGKNNQNRVLHFSLNNK